MKVVLLLILMVGCTEYKYTAQVGNEIFDAEDCYLYDHYISIYTEDSKMRFTCNGSQKCVCIRQEIK